MPMTLVDRVSLPNLKVYTAGSVLLFSIAIYYALTATSNPNWRVNTTQSRQDVMELDGESKLIMAEETEEIVSRIVVSEQFTDVVTFMIQEPLCMWSTINMAYCGLALAAVLIHRSVFGELRLSEIQRLKEKLWNYLFYKLMFVFGVVKVHSADEVVFWAGWFSLLGFLHLVVQLAKDRCEYLCSRGAGGGRAHARLTYLVVVILLMAIALLVGAARFGPSALDTFAFMAVECVAVCVCALHVCALCILQLQRSEADGPAVYYTRFTFRCAALGTEALHAAQQVAHGRMALSLPSLVLLLQLRHVLHRLMDTLRRHRRHCTLARHMSRHYPMASKEEVEKNQDNCAICWEPMKEARKLPCSHLFHNSCLCRWVQQHASCPTCRRALVTPHPHETRAPHHHRLIHFHGSRYVSWLPSFSVEVTRGETPPPGEGAPPGVAAAQLHAMFPQYSVGALLADLARTASTDITIDNILEGRLLPPAPTEPAPLAAHTDPFAGTSSDFSDNAHEREMKLMRRKEMLLANARRRYLERMERDPAPATPSPTPHS